MKFGWLGSAAAAAILVAGVHSASDAAITLDDWSMDLSALGGAFNDAANPGGYTYDNVDFLSFAGAIAHATAIDANGNGIPDVGEFGVVQGLGEIGTIAGIPEGALTPQTGVQLLNVPGGGGGLAGFELEFEFDVDIQYDNIIPLVGTDFLAVFSHLAATNATGVLEIRASNFGTDANCLQGTGAGCQDGIPILRGSIQNGDGGVLSSLTLDGSDDARFEVTFAAPGVWIDKNGVDLSTIVGTGVAFFGVTDSNFDLDPDDGDADGDGNDIDNNAPGHVVFACGTTLIDFCATEDGTFILQIPEPTSLSILGASLLGLGYFAHRRRRNKAAKAE